MDTHITVLKNEALEALRVKPGSIIVDATFGGGGHARSILTQLGPTGRIIGIDADQSAIQAGEESLGSDERVSLHEGNFRHIDSILDTFGIREVDGILADLGWRIEQFRGNLSADGTAQADGRGFSFTVDEPLIMTFGNPSTHHFVARDIVNDWREEDIVNVLKGYGEERYAKRIARGIVGARSEHPVNTTFELVRIIERSVPSHYRHARVHPATRTFQALRIAVNDELDALGTFISHAVERLAPHGRLAIITFHSLEDRIVKHQFRAYAHDGIGTLITKRPITPTDEELQANPRARSAKLRILEKI